MITTASSPGAAQKPMLNGSGFASFVGTVPATDSYFMPSALNLKSGS